MSSTRWLPLESNPDVLNKFCSGLGMPGSVAFTDVWGLDEELLAMLPSKIHAMVFLYPITDVSDNYRKEEVAKLQEEGQEVGENVFFVKQTIGNACGTIGVLHCMANAQGFEVEDGFFKTFVQDTKDMDADERAAYLESDKAQALEQAHGQSASEGQTNAEEHEGTNLHFIAFVPVDGVLYEFDGRKPFPINHGKTTDETFASDTAAVIQQFMKRDPEQYEFTTMALCDAQ